MTDLNLIETARALDDQEFRWRVTAACFQHSTGFTAMTVPLEQHYAIWQLLNPQQVDPSMVALVATWGPVATAITVLDGAVDTSGVDDQDIMDAVQESWPLVATKYPTNPLEAS